MKYFLIFLLQGKVVNICSFDDETARDNTKDYYIDCCCRAYGVGTCDGIQFDSIQILDQI